MILLELFCVWLALELARLNGVPVRKMRDFGATTRESETFHGANFQVKAALVLLLSWCTFVWRLLWALVVWQQWPRPGVVEILLGFLFVALLYSLILWGVFDIALNRYSGEAWHYIGETAKTDILLREGVTFYWRKKKLLRLPGLGGWAGRVKAFFCAASVLLLNAYLL